MNGTSIEQKPKIPKMNERISFHRLPPGISTRASITAPTAQSSIALICGFIPVFTGALGAVRLGGGFFDVFFFDVVFDLELLLLFFAAKKSLLDARTRSVFLLHTEMCAFITHSLITALRFWFLF